MSSKKHPIQPIGMDEFGILRFKGNKIIEDLLLGFTIDSGLTINHIATGNYTDEDRRQFDQLIGSSVAAYGDKPYVSQTDYAIAVRMQQEDLTEKDIRIQVLEEELASLQNKIRYFIDSVGDL